MRRIFALFLAAALLSLAGCVNYQETVKLDKSGSGTIAMHYAFNKALMDKLQEVSKQLGEDAEVPGADVEDMLDRKSLEDRLKKAKSNLKLVNYQNKTTEDEYVYEVTLSFKNPKDLGDLGKVLSSKGGNQTPGAVTFVKQDEGTWLYTRSLEPPEDEETETEEEESEAEETPKPLDKAKSMENMGKVMAAMGDMMQTMMMEAQKATVRFSAELPGKIVETNATRTEGNTAIWEYKLMEMQGGPPVMTAKVKL